MRQKNTIQRFITFTANDKREIRFYVFVKRMVHRREKCKKILTFDADAKILNFTERLKTASRKFRVNIVTWSFLPLAVVSSIAQGPVVQRSDNFIQ